MSEPQQELVAEPKPCKVPCSVGVNARQTIPLGNYANVQIGVHLSVTVEPTEIDEAFTQVAEWVSDRLGQLVEEATGGMNGEAGANS